MSTISGLLTIDQEVIRSRNTIDERAQDFVTNYELLLSMLKAYTHSEPAHYTLLEELHVSVRA